MTSCATSAPRGAAAEAGVPGPHDRVGSAHLLLGYTVLGLTLVSRADLAEDRG